MKVAIYARVSTDKQELDNQLLKLREYIKKNEWENYKEYVDTKSGKETSRPAFDELFKDAHKKLFDVVLFWDLSRFSRAGTLHTLNKLQELNNLKIDWHSYEEAYLRTDNELARDILLGTMSSIAKAERKKISNRTKAGLERVKKYGSKSGKPIGRPPISNYHKKRILELHKAGRSMYSIAKELHVGYGSVYRTVKK